MVLGLLLALAAAAPVAAVRKCCPSGESLFGDEQGDLNCSSSAHLWYYVNFTAGISECNYSRGYLPAFQGTNVSCIDNINDTDKIVALNCSGESDPFPVPNVNYLRKCCPIHSFYDPDFQKCVSHEEPSWPTAFINVLMHNAEGIVDIAVGVPPCHKDEVVVDHLVLAKDVYRDQSAAISYKIGEMKHIMNPDEVCLDRTERLDVLIVRACENNQTACKKHTCIRKCCEENESYIAELSSACFPSNRSIDPTRSFNLTRFGAKKPAYWFEIDCPYGKYIADDIRKYSLDFSGSLDYLSNGTNQWMKVDMGHFCIEHVEDGMHDGDFFFFCFPGDPPAEPWVPIWTTIGMIASSFFLFLTLAVYICLPNLQNLHGKTLICHVSCLLAAYTVLSTVHLITDQLLQQVCVIMGFFVLFTFLAAFFWLNVISFDIWWNFGSMRPVVDRKKRDFRRFVVYSLYAWSVPSILTAGSIVVQYTNILDDTLSPGIGSESCWFSRDNYGSLLFFVGPEGVIVVMNVVFFTLTSRHCSKVKSELDKVGHTAIADKKFESDKKRFIMNCKLFIVMGVSWALEFLSVLVQDPKEVWYLADVANSLQGLSIFTIFVLKRRVLNALKRRFFSCCRKPQTRRSSVSTLCTASNYSTSNNLKKSVSQTRLSPLPTTKYPNLRTQSANRLLVSPR